MLFIVFECLVVFDEFLDGIMVFNATNCNMNNNVLQWNFLSSSFRHRGAVN